MLQYTDDRLVLVTWVSSPRQCFPRDSYRAATKGSIILRKDIFWEMISMFSDFPSIESICNPVYIVRLIVFFILMGSDYWQLHWFLIWYRMWFVYVYFIFNPVTLETLGLPSEGTLYIPLMPGHAQTGSSLVKAWTSRLFSMMMMHFPNQWGIIFNWAFMTKP